MKKSDGFTLIELLVGILCASIVTGAAMTLMLMGARTNRALLDTNSEQQTARIITTMVESLASEGDIQKIYVGYDEYSPLVGYGSSDWAIFGTSPSDPILTYSFDDQTIFSTGNTPLMTGVTSSTLTLSRETLDGCLLGFTIQTEDGYYETSSYCRATNIKTEGIVLDKDNVAAEDTVGSNDPTSIDPSTSLDAEDTSDARFAFLKVLCTQYGSTGQILSPYDGTYFSEWFLYETTEYGFQDHPNWNKNTPWCACFLSWALYQSPCSAYLNEPPCFAEVAEWANYFDGLEQDGRSGYEPAAGDIIFFDWENNGYDGLEHIGAVFAVDGNNVYTIEGNNSGRVELNRYPRDSHDIKGYGVLDWKSNSEVTPAS